jgi:hypothetical protein
MPDLSQRDLDLITRTVIGEAGQEPDLGKAAVAAVVLNRMKQNNASDAASIVLAPKQFTTWSDRPGELAAISPRSQAYQSAYNIVKNVAGGNIPDPTSGALNYANVDAVKKAGNTTAMKWIDGMTNVSQIGNHTFGNADGEGIPDYVSATRVPDYISGFRNKPKTDAAPAMQDGAPAPQDQGGPDYISAFRPQKVDAPAGPKQYMIGDRPFNEDEVKNPPPNPEVKSSLQKFREAIDPINGLRTAAGTVWDKAKESWNSATDQFSNPNLAPTFETVPSKVTNLLGQESPATGVRMSDPGKLLGVIGGLGGIVTSPVSAAESGIESLTGNKDFAEKVTDLGSLAFGGKLVKDMRPSVKAVKAVDNLLPPEALQAAERNPSLAPVDVSPTARAHADMIARDTLAPRAKQAVLDFVDQRKGELKGDVQSAVETLGELPTPFDVVKQIQQRARDTGAKVINPIVKNAQPADITGVVKGIDDVIGRAEKSKLPLNDYQRRLVELRDDLRGDRPDADQMFGDVQGDQGLHQTQWKLRAEAQNLLSSSSGSDRLLGGKLMDWRNKLVDTIDTAAPGYKEGLSKFRTDKDVADAFDKGLNVSQMPGRTSESILEHSGESWKNWAQNPNTHPDELSAARLGTLSWMAHELEGVKAGKKLLDTPKNPVLQSKLETLFGKDKAEQYTDLLEDTNNRALSARIGDTGSQTFERQRAAMASPVRLPGQGHGTSATLQSLAPAILGGVAELGSLGLAHGTPTLIGLGAAGARLGYGAARHLFEQRQYKSDLARRLAEARRLTTPFSQQPDLLDYMRSKRENLGQGNKLQNLTSSPFLQLLPQ